SPDGPSAGSTASGRRSPGSCWRSPVTTVLRRLSRPPAPWSTASTVIHRANYELCRISGNEPWHQELRPQVIDHVLKRSVSCVTRQRAGRAEKFDPMLGRECSDRGNLCLGGRPRRRRGQLGTVRGLACGDHKGREV